MEALAYDSICELMGEFGRLCVPWISSRRRPSAADQSFHFGVVLFCHAVFFSSLLPPVLTLTSLVLGLESCDAVIHHAEQVCWTRGSSGGVRFRLIIFLVRWGTALGVSNPSPAPEDL